MRGPQIELTSEDFKTCDFEDPIRLSEKKECDRYMILYREKAESAKKSGDQKAEAIYTLMNAITSFALSAEPTSPPFRPFLIWDDRRSAAPEDTGKQQLEVLREVAPDISDPELRARICDFLWTKKSDYKMAEIAVEAYLDSVAGLENSGRWHKCNIRIKRALQLAASLHKGGLLYEKVIGHIENILDRGASHEAACVFDSMMELLIEERQGDPCKYAPLAGCLAKQAEDGQIFHAARIYWRIKSDWHRIGGDEKEKHNALVCEAEAYYKEASKWISSLPPRYLNATGLIKKTIEAYRRIGGQQTRIEELRRELLEYEKKSISELQQISTSLGVKGRVEAAIARVSGKALDHALRDMVLLEGPSSVSELRTIAKETIVECPLQSLVGAGAINIEGKTIGIKPAVSGNDVESMEPIIRAEMIEISNMHHAAAVAGSIEPARRQIALEHRVTIRDFHPIVINNPFIPPGREYTFARGLYAGLTGDFLVAASLLIMQLENCFRYVLNQHRIITSKLDANGIEEEFDLNVLIRMPEFEEVFSADLTFDLRVLLVERLGANLRNRLAHGLISDAEYSSRPVIYSWWSVLRLCMLPLIVAKENENISEKEEYTEGSDSSRNS